jgi:hypothetical protein
MYMLYTNTKESVRRLQHALAQAHALSRRKNRYDGQ